MADMATLAEDDTTSVGTMSPTKTPRRRGDSGDILPPPITPIRGHEAVPQSPEKPRVSSGSEVGTFAYRKRPWVVRMALKPFLLVITLLYATFAAFVLVLRFQCSMCLFSWRSLRERSFFCRQVEHRMRTICEWPMLFQSIRKHKSTAWRDPRNVISERVTLYTSIATAIVDVMLGLLAASYLMNSPGATDAILSALHSSGQILHVDVLRSQVTWLMHVPAGFKLNHELTHFLGSSVLNVIALWNFITTFLTPYEPLIMKVAGYCGLFGISFVVALAADIVHAMTRHIYYLYEAFARFHGLQLSVLGSLFRLFRGSKQNVLRNRIDHCDYDVSQLLLGTLMLSLMCFLFPTSVVYYIFFSVVWVAVLLVKSVLWWILAALNRLPVGLVIILKTNPMSLPGGIRIKLFKQQATPVPLSPTAGGLDDLGAGGDGGGGGVPGDFSIPTPLQVSRSSSVPSYIGTSYMELSSLPPSAALVFILYRAVVGDLTSHYTVGQLLQTLVFGSDTAASDADFIPEPTTGSSGFPISLSAYYKVVAELMDYSIVKQTEV